MTVDHFEQLYSQDSDPFKLGDSWYERRKMDLVMASLAGERYRRTWDTACGTGHLAERLVARSEQLLATDASAAACRLAAARLSEFSSAQVAEHLLPATPPSGGTFDLIVLSEILYYLDTEERADLVQVLDAVAERSCAAEVVLVSWRHHPDDADVSGADSALECDAALTSLGWSALVVHDDRDFVLRSWQRPAMTS